MWTWRIVRHSLLRSSLSPFVADRFLPATSPRPLFYPPSRRRPTTGEDLVRRNLRHLSGSWSTSRPQEPVRFLLLFLLSLPTQSSELTFLFDCSYIILPADFEQAWKDTVKRTDERPDFCPFSLLLPPVPPPRPRHRKLTFPSPPSTDR
jgi:hypothetical protein